MKKSFVAALSAAAALAGILVAPSSPAVATTPTIAVNRAVVAQRDPVVVSGRTSAKSVAIYQRLGKGAWHKVHTVRASHGRYRWTTRPTPGRVNHYRAASGTSTATVRSAPCTPLAAHGHVGMWRQDLTHDSTLPKRWAQIICSAAPRSTVSVAVMFVYNNSPYVSAIVNALRTVHAYRGVHVRIVIQRGKYYDTAKEWASVKRLFGFAEFHYCQRGCHSSSPTSHAHDKFTVVSKTIFGGSAVIESTANWSKNQFTGQRESGIYVYNNAVLTRGYLAAWNSLVTHKPVNPAVWRSAGWGLYYSFDPHPATQDPFVTELRTVACRPGDTIGVVNVYITRPALVAELNRLHDDGCLVRAVRHEPTSLRSAKFPLRTTTLHDKYVVVTAHTRSGAVRREVIHGSADFTTSALVESDQQTLLVRRDDLWSAYRNWFAYLWGQGKVETPAARAAADRHSAATPDDD